MNKSFRKTFLALITMASSFSLVNCHGGEEFDADGLGQGHELSHHQTHQETVDAIVVEIPVSAPAKQAAKAKPVSADLAPAAPIVPAPAVADRPSYFGLDPSVPPWQANYVSSYGLLPTRFQDKGPFLYSFDVSPEAAASEDNVYLGPYEFFTDIDDDNGYDDE